MVFNEEDTDEEDELEHQYNTDDLIGLPNEEADVMCQTRRSYNYDRMYIKQRTLTIASLPEWL